MTRIVTIVFVLAAVGLGVALAADSELSDLQQLKAENFRLRVHVAELRATLADREARLASMELSQLQTALVEEFRKTVGSGPSATFDWTTLRFKDVTEEPK